MFCLLAFAGCATYPAKNAPAVDKSGVFSVPYDIAWDELKKTVMQEGEEVTTADKNGGVIGLKRNISPGDIPMYAYDDTGMFWSKAVAQAVILVSALDERSTAITINLKILATGRDAFDVIFSRNRQMTLHSRGTLEKYYLDAFANRISVMKKDQ